MFKTRLVEMRHLQLSDMWFLRQSHVGDVVSEWEIGRMCGEKNNSEILPLSLLKDLKDRTM